MKAWIIAYAVLFITAAAWVTHVLVSIKTGAYLLLIVGAVFFPIGIIHGVGVWLGIV